MGSKLTKFFGMIGFAGLGVFAALHGLKLYAEPKPDSQAPPLLQRVQALGDLHAVKYCYRDIHDFQTVEEPTPWLSVLPGGEDLVHAATRNSTTMSFDGTVEAGVDLTRAKVQNGLNGVTIELPFPTVYKPEVSAQVHELHRGWVWRDDSITVAAIEDAKQRFRDTSIRQGILESAKRNVRARVMNLSRSLTNSPVTVVFRSDLA